VTDYAIFAQCVRDEKDIDPVMVLFNAVQKKRTFCHLVVLFLALPIMRTGGTMAEAKTKKRINTKAKGTRLEHRTMKVLEAAGYKCCRSAASLGEWDVIAVGPTNVRLVQVKANRRPGSVEMETLHSFVAPSNCSREVWVWKDRARQPIIEIL